MKTAPIFFMIFFNFIFAQKKGIVYYGYIQSLTEGNAKGADSNSYMVFNSSKSYYVTAKDSLESKAVLGGVVAYSKSYEGKRDYTGKRSAQGDQVVLNLKENRMYSRFFSGSAIYVLEDKPILRWNIKKDIKKIGVFDCRKAEVLFRGRNYIAWFTDQIAVPFGPWKLNGLPGLILEAYDNDKNVFWYFKNVEYPTQNKENVNNIRKAKNEKIVKFIDFKSFLAKCELIRQDDIELNRTLSKQLNGVIFEDPKLSDLFLEVEK